MYHAQFGLERSLFGDGIAADAAVFRSPKHDEISAHFKLALGSPSSCLVLRGPAGVGKTTLTSAALRASSTRLALAWLNATPANASELLELILVELGISTAGTTRIDRLQLWRQFQGEMRATESRLFVVVERTEDLSCEVLHALDSLTAPDAAGNLGANVVLLGHAGIDEHISAPILESLRQRIRLRTELTPFTEAELQDYLRHQVACAGGHFDHVFAPGTVAALYRHSGGVARLANTLCATALELAASQQQKLLTAELVAKTAVSILGLAGAAPAASSASIVVNVTAAVPAAPLVVSAPPAVEPPNAVTPFAPVVLTSPVARPPTTAPTAAVPPSPAAARSAAPAPTAAPAPAASAARAAPAPVTAAPPTLPVATAPTPVPPAAPPPAPTPAPAPTLKTSAPATPAPIVEFEFDGGATDITDVAMADFPVLTDAVELPPAPPIQRAATPAPPAPSAAAAEPAAATPKTLAAKPRVRAPVAAPPPAAAKPVSNRIETAYAPSKAPTVPKPAAVAAPKPTPPPTLTADSDDDDVLRQTQTMRAIAVAKSIDDISSSMAETLFGDAELDLVTAAALASAAEWSDGDGEPAAPAPRTPEPAKPAATAARKPEPAKPAAPVDDPFDLFGLGDDAPLELIDDSTLPPTGVTRKSAAR